MTCAEMIVDLQILDTKSYLIRVASTVDGIAALTMLFDLLKESCFSWSAGLMDDVGNGNGWAIEKTSHGFLFEFLCSTPMHGFAKGHGAVYCYKYGDDQTSLPWPSVESASLP